MSESTGQEGPREPIAIRAPAELDALPALPNLRAAHRRRIRLDDAGSLDPELKRRFEVQLNRLYHSCGCETAALGLAVWIFAYIGWLAARDGGFGALSWRDAGLGLAAAIVATLTGKLAGRLLAAAAFHRAIRELKQQWSLPG